MRLDESQRSNVGAPGVVDQMLVSWSNAHRGGNLRALEATTTLRAASFVHEYRPTETPLKNLSDGTFSPIRPSSQRAQRPILRSIWCLQYQCRFKH